MSEPGAALTSAGRVSEAPVPPAPTEQERGAEPTGGGVRSVLLPAATGLALVILGAVLGVVGAFLNAARPYGVPVGPVLAVVGNLGAGVLGTRGLGSRLGGALPACGWFTVVALLGSLRAEGDLIVSGDGRGVTFIMLGALAAAAALVPGTGGTAGRQ